MVNPVRIFSPVPKGSGATVVHQLLADNMPDYSIGAYNPYWTLFPIILPFIISTGSAGMIHCPPDYAWFLANRKKPLILTFHNYVLDQWMRQYSTRFQKIHYGIDLKWWTKLSLKYANRITAVSHYIADLVRTDLNLGKEISVIYNGIDTEIFRPGAGPDRRNNRTVRVFFSGNLTVRKGIQWLPAIADRLNPNIVIYYTSGLRTKIKLPRRPNLIPIGKVPYNAMPERYQNMDILLMPTVREGFGLSIAEAMACGLPVVASNCSAVPELIDHEKGGYLCPVGDVRDFSAKINVLADSPGQRKEMGQYNRAKAEHRFTIQRMIREYTRLFESI